MNQLFNAHIYKLTAMVLALSLAGCGGGGTVDSIAPEPSNGLVTVTPEVEEPTDPAAEEETANELYLLTDFSGILMDKGSQIAVTALVVDDNNGVLANKAVEFKITNPDATGVFSTTSSQIITDENGRATIILQVLGNLNEQQIRYLEVEGVQVQAKVDNVTQSLTIYGSEDSVDLEKKDIYDLYISPNKNEMLTGSDTLTLNIRVTDKNGGTKPNVPVYLSITEAAKYGMTLNGSSKRMTDENGTVKVEVIQNRTGVDAQLNHETLLTVTVNDDKNSIVEQTLPLKVRGTHVDNVKTSKSVVEPNQDLKISGILNDGANVTVANADVALINNSNEVAKTKTNSKGEFEFKVNAQDIVATDEGYVFALQASGDTNSQIIPDIISVGSIVSSGMTFSQTNDIELDDRQKIVLNVPNAANNDSVVISTNKGKIYLTENANSGTSRLVLPVFGNQVTFFVESAVPGSATIRAEYEDEVKEADIDFVSTNPTKLLLQIENSVVSLGDSTTVMAKVLDDKDSPVKNAIVQFTTVKDASGGSLDRGVAYTDENGVARINYTAGANPTSADGVIIEAQVESLKLPNNTEKAVNTLLDSVGLTVQTRSTYISFAFADKVSSGNRQIYYYRNGSISVLNSSGKPAVNQPVSINILPSEYIKGKFVVRLLDQDDDGDADSSYIKVWDINPGPVSCANEDSNYNGVLDEGEDVNGNGQLDPVNVAAILNDQGQEVASDNNFNFVTDATGKVDFQIRYPKEYAQWYSADVIVNTRVDGSEARRSRSIDFPVLADDVNINKPFRPNWVSPFGVIPSCQIPN